MEAGGEGGSGSHRTAKKKGKKAVEDRPELRAVEEDEKRRKKGSRCCQAEKCTADLEAAKAYHRRHRVCELHSKAPDVLVGGLHQRFCQQCSRFHELWEFDDIKRSCRRRLAGHNERRRKSAAESQPRGVRAGKAE